MTRNVLKYFVFLSIVTACEKIENENFQPMPEETRDKVISSNGHGWKWMASFQNTEMSITDADMSSYGLKLRQTIRLTNDEAIIKEAGFKVLSSQNNGVMILPATISHSDNELVSEAVLQCKYGGYYSITPLIAIDDYKFYGEEQTFSRSIEEMKPKLENMVTDVEMASNAHTITAVVETEGMVDDVTFTFAGATQKGVKNGSRFTADFDLNSLESSLSGNVYEGISYTATNMFGQTKAVIAYSVRVVDYQENYYNKKNDSDGVKSNYITIGGVNWAKGNLVCKNGTWGIDDNPLGHEATKQDNELVQFFNFGVTTSEPSRFLDAATAASLPTSIAGDKRYDVAAANMDGWRLPSYNEAMSLLFMTSQQNCNGGIVLYPIENRDKMFYSSSQVTLTSVPADGLFLPNGGLYSLSNRNGIAWANYCYNLGAYMTDDIFTYTSLGSTYIYNNCLYFYNPNPDNNSMMGLWYIFDAAYRGYGAYNMGNKTHFSVYWKYYVRPVYVVS